MKYLKRTISQLMALTIMIVMCVSTISTSAVYSPNPFNVLDQKYIENDNYTYYIDTDYSKAVIINIKSGTEVLNIPETVTYKNTTYPVSAIFISASEGYSDFHKSIKIINASKNIEEIDISLFGEQGVNPDKLSLLETINVPENSKLNSIYLGYCPSLKNINLATNSKLESISISSCLKMTKIYLPKTVRYLGFSDAPKLKVKIAKNNKYLKVKGNQILSKNGKTLTEIVGNKSNVTVYKTVREIDHFSSNKYIKNLTIGKNVTKLKSESFSSNCEKLSKVTIKNTKKSPKIEENAFKGTKKGIKFYVKNKKVAKSLKKQLKGSGVRKAKIYVGKTLVYKNVK